MSEKFKKIAVFFNHRKEDCRRRASEIIAFIEARGISAVRVEAESHGQWVEEADLVIALGGDGTVLHAARDLASLGIPLLGINSGTLGFLSGLEGKEFSAGLEKILAGDYVCQDRFMLEASIYNGGKRVSEPQLALNDCVLKALSARAFRLSAKYGGRPLKVYFGDGLIVSTPSGSTAYALAASGPIVHPQLDVFLLVPICPHTLAQRPLVLPAAEPILLSAETGHGDFSVQPVMSLDGQVNFLLNPGDEVRITRFGFKLKLVLPSDYDYFGVLSAKLKWGERA